MAGLGRKIFTAGDVLTASDLQSYAVDQSVMVFGGTAARSSAIPTPSEGMTSYRTDTQQIESYDGANWVGMSGLQLVKKQTIGSGVSSVNVTSAFSATYENYKIVVSNGSGSTSNYVGIKLGSTATGYYNCGVYATYASTTPVGFSFSNATSWAQVGYMSANVVNVNLELFNPFLATNTVMTAQLVQTTTVGLATSNAGWLNDLTSYTAFTLTPASGTFNGGTIYIYGYGAS